MLFQPGKTYGPCNVCIYCGSTSNLTREHIIPMGLGGEWVLQKASCKACSSITGEFERGVLKQLLGVFRSYYKYPTRRPKKRLKTIELTIKTDGKILNRSIPIDLAPFVAPVLPFFPIPGFISGKPTDRLDHNATTMWQPETPPFVNEALLAVGFIPGTEIINNGEFVPVDLLRMIAKIGHSAAVSRFGVDAVDGDEWILPKYIKAEEHDVHNVVGTTGRLRNFPPKYGWTVSERIISVQGVPYYCFDVALIAIKGSPVYTAVVCKANARMIRMVEEEKELDNTPLVR